MNDLDTVLLTELIASRICHDLTSPVGAVSNGVEILEEMGTDSEVTSLIAFSARQAAAKLKTLRMAYGLGGADEHIKLENVHEIFGEFIDGDGRVKQDWDPNMNPDFEPRRGFPKLLMSCLILGADSLPRGGVISVEMEGDDVFLITAEGANAALKENVADALALKTPVNNLSPKLIHPYIMGLFSHKYGYEIVVNDEKENFIFLRLKQSVVS